MAVFRVEKPVSTLPGQLTANTIYLLRVGAGFELHITDTTGAVAYKLNDPALAHSVLTGLQGGTTGEFYHLTAAQHGKIATNPKITVASTAPSSPATGDLWVDTT